MADNKKHIMVAPEVHRKLKLKSVEVDIEMYTLANKYIENGLKEEE